MAAAAYNSGGDLNILNQDDLKTQSRGRSSLLYSPQNFQFCTGKPSPPSAELALSLLVPGIQMETK